MSDVLDGEVVMPAPEERYGIERFAPAEHVPRRHLTLTLGHDPVLDADVLARVRIRPARNIARCEDSALARFEILVNDDAMVQGEAGRLGQRNCWPDADAHDDQIGVERAAAAEADGSSVDGGNAFPEVKTNAV